MLLGLAAMAVVDGDPSRGRAAAVASLLLLSLMASGTGLVMCVAVCLEWLLDPRWRGRLPCLLPPALAYMAWYLSFGRSGVATIRDPYTLQALADVPRFVVGGFANGGAAISGTGVVGGLAVAVGVLAWSLARAWQGRPAARPPALLAAIAVEYGLIGLVRGNLFAGQVDYTRYTYASGILLLVAVGTLAGRTRYAPPRRFRPVVVATAISVVGLAFAFNIALLVGGRELFLERADMTRALVTAGLRRPLPAGTDPERTLVLVPAPASLERIVAAYGNPKTDALVPFAVRPIPSAVQAEADRRVREGAPVQKPQG
jgi:hypothetical protein